MKCLQHHCVICLSVLLLIPAAFGSREGRGEIEDMRVNKERLERHIAELAGFGKTPEGGVNRVAYSDEDIESRKFLIRIMSLSGLEVHVDEAGNIIGRLKGVDSTLPPIVFGSHTDTVPHGGKYDGAVGVLSAIECVQIILENGIQTRHPLEVIVFTDEEGGLVGSRAMNGSLTPKALDEVSHSGKTVREGIVALGGDPDRLDNVLRKKGEIEAFLEIHIEQGRVLEDKDIDIGVVEGIVGIAWWDVTVEGFSNHAGTTPMNRRQDALLAAAQFVLAVNRIVTSVPGSQVGTVGRIRAEPGAPNVIPGKVVMSLELRDLSAEKIFSLFEMIKKEAAAIADSTETRFSFDPIDAMAIPAPTDPAIREKISESARELGLSTHFMPSGAGHDAQDMAKIAPTGMIFIPSIGGVSHSPREFSKIEDIVNGANVLLQTILRIDRN